MRFEGKTVLVTGGATGIGRACADRFASEGAVVVTAQRSASDAYIAFQADLSDPCACQQVIEDTIKRTGRLDVLINNAGLMREGTVEETDLETWTATLALNLTAPFLLTKHALPFLRKQGGAIVNIGSVEGLGSNPRHPAYCASKAGLHGLTRAVAIDHSNEGIRCNAVAPGWIDTDLNVDFINSMDDPETFQQNLSKIHPVGRTGRPEEVAALVTWLASEDASFVTGQIYTIDGGRMAKLSLP